MALYDHYGITLRQLVAYIQSFSFSRQLKVEKLFANVNRLPCSNTEQRKSRPVQCNVNCNVLCQMYLYVFVALRCIALHELHWSWFVAGIVKISMNCGHTNRFFQEKFARFKGLKFLNNKVLNLINWFCKSSMVYCGFSGWIYGKEGNGGKYIPEIE